MAALFNFVVKTSDIVVKFSCANHTARTAELARNLRLAGSGDERGMSYFRASAADARFSFGGGEFTDGNEVLHDAVFFENTDYPLIVRSAAGAKLRSVELYVADHLKGDGECALQSDDGELYGSFNFHNQVGATDFKVVYETGAGEKRLLKIETEVLSYKLDYRSDLKTILADVEDEYAMLSYSLLKDTYLNFRTKAGMSSELIWWQIFRSCYDKIVKAAGKIIDRPRRKLKAAVTHERAERLRVLPREAEREYEKWKDDGGHLYRSEELVLSHDTLENRFLKYALFEMRRKFLLILRHLETAMRLTDARRLCGELEGMQRELERLTNHPFFRGVGVFRGFSQESLVMKHALGYCDILKCWIELQQGYDLEEGMRKLEVKDISDLYEIWCFIKVKNIVAKVLEEMGAGAEPKVNGRNVSRDFIPQLVHGGSVSFLKGDGVELASVSYNAEVNGAGSAKSAIEETQTFTTAQRPDIVLRLSKENDEIKYTYLFDAKYRINDTQIGEQDVPPEDAIDQLHRYRDAIYYKGAKDGSIKKEVVAGYVLFPGNVSKESITNGEYHYERSNRAIGIGAFPLRPERKGANPNGEGCISAKSSEEALHDQIRKWLEDHEARETLLNSAIPQKGLEYTDEPVVRGAYLLSMVDGDVNEEKAALVAGTAKSFVSGYALLTAGINFQSVKFLAIVENHKVSGYYQVEGVAIVDMTKRLTQANSPHKDKPYRVELKLGEYTAIEPFSYGVDRAAAKGVILKAHEFRKAMRRTDG